MAKITLASYIKSIHGRIGNVIYYNVKGYQYARSWSMPRNPRTEEQQANRKTFADAVKLWQSLTHEEKATYNRMAADKQYSGYNLFISMQMKGTGLYIKSIIRAAEIKKRLIPPSFQSTDRFVSPPFLYRHGFFAKGNGDMILQKGYKQMPRAA